MLYSNASTPGWSCSGWWISVSALWADTERLSLVMIHWLKHVNRAWSLHCMFPTSPDRHGCKLKVFNFSPLSRNDLWFIFCTNAEFMSGVKWGFSSVERHITLTRTANKNKSFSLIYSAAIFLLDEKWSQRGTVKCFRMVWSNVLNV